MARLRFDAVKGALASALGSGDTTISSPGLARLGNINSPDVALVCLYATDSAGNITTSENVYVTSHVAGTTTATVTRAGDGTTAQAWVNGSQWTHGFGVADVADVEANAGGDVTSVNGYTGAVTLAASDVGALGATAAAGGDLTGSYPNPTLAAAGSAGTYPRSRPTRRVASQVARRSQSQTLPAPASQHRTLAPMPLAPLRRLRRQRRPTPTATPVRLPALHLDHLQPPMHR